MNSTPKDIDSKRVPKHVAIIMDGNGRWAKKQGFLTRVRGHEIGVEALRNIATASAEIGIEYLTVYAFSTENWNRPKAEVGALMQLLVSTLGKELSTLQENGIRLNSIGQLDALPKNCQTELNEVMEATRNNNRMVLTLALNYGAKTEIVNAVQRISEKVASGELKSENIDELVIDQHMFTADIPHPELLIRTSGEYRISNYLLWQIAYSELYFTPVLWPDFKKEDLYDAIRTYQSRERRFGKTSEQIQST
ncbi:isoprenyl transferase [Phaeocystidibacter luteus]|uniref:Isoprenyl transferase n=1 Tax=Phaeocystidibacter luteus TaxID=911197 RepID=A0A6N6RJ37_9FLAO|nr:isoprenyl transferase [Phaeocystidibacter luteus]KAB2813624.1 isoprenyl transferase [Phaeocystidibacter luteus]